MSRLSTKPLMARLATKLKTCCVQKASSRSVLVKTAFRQLTTNKKEVVTPDDMKGQKIRIPSMKMYIDLYKALGADPTVMNFAEVFTSLQQGTIDGQENPVPVIYTSKLAEVQKYMTIWNYSYDPIVLGVNKKMFDALDKETQNILRQTAKEACEYQVKLNREEEAKQLAEMKSEGHEGHCANC